MIKESYSDSRPDGQYEYGLDNQLTLTTSNNGKNVDTEKCYTYELGDRLLRMRTWVTDSSNSDNNDYQDNYFYYSHDGVAAERPYTSIFQVNFYTRLGRELFSCVPYDNSSLNNEYFGSYFYIQNIRGDVTMAVDSSNSDVKFIRDYNANGEMLCQAPYDKESYSISRDPFGFIGGLDMGDGLWKLGARYYDSSTGSFIQQDRYMGDPGDPLSLNRYVYCNLDPVNYVDPTGFDPEGIVYLRINSNTWSLYVGQAKSDARFQGRQYEHVYKNGQDYDYEILGHAEPGKDLDILEQKFINEYGGAQSMGGTLDNKYNKIDPSMWDELGISPISKSEISDTEAMDYFFNGWENRKHQKQVISSLMTFLLNNIIYLNL